ncbi:MAG TPA: hypothetical protein VGQ91_10420 [Ideonella sp.]|jgi:hypothetical protein|nr:hypothetical protein [Ideonella sp.]
MHAIRRRLLGAIPLALAVALGACAGLTTPPHVRYSEAELNQMLARRFPLEGRVLEVIELSLAKPLLTLKPESRRLATRFELQASERLSGQRWHGEVALDYGLKLDRSDQSLRIAEPRVTALSLQRNDGRVASSAQAERLGGLAIEHLLEGAVIHRLKPEQVERLAQAGWELGEVKVDAAGVEITTVLRR